MFVDASFCVGLHVCPHWIWSFWVFRIWWGIALGRCLICIRMMDAVMIVEREQCAKLTTRFAQVFVVIQLVLSPSLPVVSLP
jgi:hypothetical protein